MTESWSTLIDVIYTNDVDRVACSGVSHILVSAIIALFRLFTFIGNYLTRLFQQGIQPFDIEIS